MIPTTRDHLLQHVVDGQGDIAAGNLTATDERRKIVDFVAPADQKPVSEGVVTGPRSPAIATADDLAGKTVHVRKASSHYESLVALNARLKKDGKAAANPLLVPDALEDEDPMEMLDAGLLEVIVVDDWKARIWAQVLPKSAVGAVGVMQLMPATGAELRVGDITLMEPNIHAGAKYMDRLMSQYFQDAKFEGPNRTLFAFAAYNAGPGRIAQMRT